MSTIDGVKCMDRRVHEDCAEEDPEEKPDAKPKGARVLVGGQLMPNA